MGKKGPVVELMIQVNAPGLSREEVASYVRDAVNGYKGCLAADDPCRNVEVKKIMGLAWVEVGDDAGRSSNEPA